ncbi:MAG: hypothetical protein BWZ10_01590 [candidate division BRC1 bacterium ADurb.BinA364]|nr:MAG: hypothetical protein BWZ10_01590 [candidate division BRC1 bacterium ADurb.BinA364]
MAPLDLHSPGQRLRREESILPGPPADAQQPLGLLPDRRIAQSVADGRQQPAAFDKALDRLHRRRGDARLAINEQRAIAFGARAEHFLVHEIDAVIGVLQRDGQFARIGVGPGVLRVRPVQPGRLADQHGHGIGRGRAAQRVGPLQHPVAVEFRPIDSARPPFRLLEQRARTEPHKPARSRGNRDRRQLLDEADRFFGSSDQVHRVAGDALLGRAKQIVRARQMDRIAVAEIARDVIDKLRRRAGIASVVGAVQPLEGVIAAIEHVGIDGMGDFGHLTAVVVEAFDLQIDPGRPVRIGGRNGRLALACARFPSRLAMGAIAHQRARVIAIDPQTARAVGLAHFAQNRQQARFEQARAVGARARAGPMLPLAGEHRHAGRVQLPPFGLQLGRLPGLGV